MVTQSILPPFIAIDYKSLPPNMSRTIDVKGGIPGIDGIQKITTDSKGYRTTKSIDYDNKDFDIIRIFAVGASTTEQIYLDDQSVWTHLLQSQLSEGHDSRIEVINTGLSGLRAVNHYATLKEVSSYEPDVVIFLLGINDWNYHIREKHKTEGLSSWFVDPDKTFLLKDSLLGRFVSDVIAIQETNQVNGDAVVREEYGEFFKYRRGSLNREIEREYYPDEVRSDYKVALSNISALCIQLSTDCVFVDQPNGYSTAAEKAFTDGFWMTPPSEEYTLSLENMSYIANLYNSYLREFASKNNHIFCEAASGFELSEQMFYDDCHFNDRGSVKMADMLRSCLVEHDIPNRFVN